MKIKSGRNILLFLFIFSNSLFSQTREQVYYQKSVYFDLGANYQSFKYSDITLSEISFPVQVTIPFSEYISLDINNIPVMVSQKINDDKMNINSITDTRVGLRIIFLNSNAMINLFSSLPTGKRKLTVDQFDLETDLGLNILKFRMPLLGQGLNAGGSFLYALPISRSNVLGFGASINYKSKFEPVDLGSIGLETILDYDPGDDLGFNLSYVYQPLPKFKFSFDVMYSIYTKDKINGQDIFRTGNRTSLIAQLNFSTEPLIHTVLIQDKISAYNRQFIQNQWLYVKDGQKFEGLYNLLIPFNKIFSISAQGQIRYFQSGQENWNGVILNTGCSVMYSGGLGIRYLINKNFGLECWTKYYNGEINDPQNYTITGIDIFTEIFFNF